MEIVAMIRLSCIGAGILFLLLDFRAYVRRNLTENMGLGWAVFSVLLMVAGVVLGTVKQLNRQIFLLMIVLGLLLLLLLFRISIAISVLSMKNQELAMQVSLLNQENERILHAMGMLEDEKKDSVCH